MNLILWRHAEAHPGDDDLARELTENGQEQALAMAHWLKKRLPAPTRILVSPAARTRQTIQALTSNYEICDSIAPDCSAADLLNAAGWPEGKTALLVGHQPTLGRVTALLLSGSESDLSIRKGALWWLASRVRNGQRQVTLRAAITPGVLGKPWSK